MLRPTVGLKLDGAVVADGGEGGRVGEPVWGPVGLLRDLEVRLGLWGDRGAAPEAVRVQRWARRLARLAPTGPFFARSFAVDPIGTARMALAWRDGLVEAGWGGTTVPGGGTRLDAFAALEAMAEPVMVPGFADRLAAVEVEVALLEVAPYAALAFVEERERWPYRWQRVFALLAERGAALRSIEPLRGSAAPGSDLARLQAAISGAAGSGESTEATAAGGVADAAGDDDDAGEDAGERGVGGVRGDGSLVLLRAATTIEAAEAVAAMVGGLEPASVAIVRPAQETLLDEALVEHGGRTLGAKPASRWRAALQVLPIAIDLVFEPIDPRRVLELLGLAVSPFSGTARYMLSAALVDAPGIGGPRWREAKRRVHERIARRRVAGEDRGRAADTEDDVATPEDIERADREVALIEAWLEGARHDAEEGAPTAVIMLALTRVGDWLRGRLASGHGDAIDAAAAAQCDDLRAMLVEDGRERWGRVAIRQALDEVTDDGAVAELTVEQAGRADHVDHPGALLAPRDTVIWWHFVAETARPPHRARWRRAELEALAACGVIPTEPAALLAQEAAWWRNAALGARRRLVLVVPEADRGERTAPHPLWDEIVARLDLGDDAIVRITMRVADLLTSDATRPSTPRSLTLAPRPGRTEEGRTEHDDEQPRAPAEAPFALATEELAPLRLPPARATWRVQPRLIAPATRWTPTSLRELLECPLRWTLANAAGVRGVPVPTLHAGPMLNGTLGHRLVEELIASGGLERGRSEVIEVIDRLLPETAAWLLQPGLALELAQLRHQLVTGVEALAAVIADAGLTIAGVEEVLTGTWMGAELDGRLALRLHDAAGGEVILDLKWGHGSYRDLLAQGRAVQLAFYARARATTPGARGVPPAAYFSLGRGRLLAIAPEAFGAVGGAAVIDGPSVEETIDRIEATVPLVQAALAAGEVLVTGVAAAGPLLAMLDVDDGERERHYQVPPRRETGTRDDPPGCQHCRLGPICGRTWEDGA